jgi:hypothetical protein
MTIKDKLEIGLKEDAPFRKDNVPESQQSPGIPDTDPDDPTRSPVDPKAVALEGKGTQAKKAPRPEPGDLCETK